MNILVFITAFLSVLLTSFAQIALRKTMLSVDKLPSSLAEGIHFCIHLTLNAWFITGMSLYVFSLALWLVVLKNIEVSQAYPLSAMGFLITAVIGYFFLNEDLNILRIVGLLLIVVGIFIISGS